MILNKRGELKELFAELCGAEDPISLLGYGFKPISVFHTGIDSKDVLKKVVFTEVFHFLLQDLALGIIVDCVDTSNLICNGEKFPRS